MINSSWFVIINPKAGHGAALKQWPKIQLLLKTALFNFKHAFTSYSGHATKLAIAAVNQGYKNIICVGGDGTLHAVVNGLMLQKKVESSTVTIGIIPIGTGNDWVKTYNIPNEIEGAIQLIKNNKIRVQDVGKIDFLDTKNTSIYFNNLAGIGFDGLVAKKTEKLKHLGKFAYLIAACKSVFSVKNYNLEITHKNNTFTTKSLMVLVGLCTYSGGGMRLTHTPIVNDGFFDVTNVTNFNLWDFIFNLFKLYNGKVNTIKKVQTFKTNSLVIKTNKSEKDFYIQADGEVFKAESIRFSILKNALSFYC